jgi:hypothetical protein
MEIKSQFQSSFDPTKVSMMWSNLAKLAVTVVAYFAVKQGMNPTDSTNIVQAWFDAIAQVIPVAFGAVHASLALYGFVRRFFVAKPTV